MTATSVARGTEVNGRAGRLIWIERIARETATDIRVWAREDASLLAAAVIDSTTVARETSMGIGGEIIP